MSGDEKEEGKKKKEIRGRKGDGTAPCCKISSSRPSDAMESHREGVNASHLSQTVHSRHTSRGVSIGSETKLEIQIVQKLVDKQLILF